MSVSVSLPDDLAARLADEARRRHVSTDELAATLLARDLPTSGAVSDRPLLRGLIGIGASNGTRSAAAVEDVMAAEGFGR